MQIPITFIVNNERNSSQLQAPTYKRYSFSASFWEFPMHIVGFKAFRQMVAVREGRDSIWGYGFN